MQARGKLSTFMVDSNHDSSKSQATYALTFHFWWLTALRGAVLDIIVSLQARHLIVLDVYRGMQVLRAIVSALCVS